MLQIEFIESLDRPELEPYRTMKRQEEHRQQQIFVAEGEKVVRRLLESSFQIVSVLLPPKWVDDFRPLINLRREDVRVYVAPKEQLEALTGFSMYQGVLAVGKIPAPYSLERILESSRRPYLFAAADGLSSAENLGGLIRNCVAFGAQALFVSSSSSSPFLRRAVRSSMGAIFHLPVIEGADLSQILSDLRRKEVRRIAAHPHANLKQLSKADLTMDCCIVFGSEGYGISPQVLDLCDEAVAIPMPTNVDSLNVGSAAAVFLYEANRQRGRS